MPSISAVDQATGRKFHWDDPDDITSVDQLTFLLSLHGGGSAVAWHGERETVALQETSLWAEKCGARPRVRLADVVRMDKGHTEGLEPKVTQRLLEMMVGAAGGRARIT